MEAFPASWMAALRRPPVVVGYRIERVPDRPVLDVDRLREVCRHDNEAVIRYVVGPLDDLGYRPSLAAYVAGFLEQLDREVLILA